MARTGGAAGGSDWRARVAGGLLIAVGVLNAVFGLLSLLTDLVLLGTAAGGALLLAGVVTSALGLLVWRGSRPAALVALTVFGILLVVQLGDVLVEGGEGALPRLVIMGMIVAALVFAVVGHRRAPVASGG